MNIISVLIDASMCFITNGARPGCHRRLRLKKKKRKKKIRQRKNKEHYYFVSSPPRPRLAARRATRCRRGRIESDRNAIRAPQPRGKETSLWPDSARRGQVGGIGLCTYNGMSRIHVIILYKRADWQLAAMLRTHAARPRRRVKMIKKINK